MRPDSLQQRRPSRCWRIRFAFSISGSSRRNRSIEYSFEEAEGVWTCTAIVDGTAIAAVRLRDRLGSDEETKREVAVEAFKMLEAPVHWLAFLARQHHLEVEYQIEEEEGVRVCSVYVDGLQADRVEWPTKGVVTEREMREAAAKEAIEVVESRFT
ncbi:hypothetical protein F5148DRAFT_756303 [Russula earlei]|uniref:Uncharacterized protein n=1 Tax=Russula earlei TaxID=71964 RepID=A0ACC0UCW2_9AGAM|nr:hypothetical protein F5148DRAFT_756303 [Russula earlei]